MGSPGADEKAIGQAGRPSSLWPPSWQWHLVPLSRRLSLDLTQMLRLILMLGTDTTDMEDTGDTMVDIAHTVTATMERDLLMLSPLPKPLPTLRPRLILGTDIDTMDTAHTDMDTMERGLLMLSPLLMPLPMPALRLILGTDTTDTDTGLTDMDTMDTAHTDMLTGAKLKPTTTCCFSLPTLL